MNLHFPPTGAEWTFFVCAVVILAGPILAQRARLPGMVGLILGGLLIGPNGLDWVERSGVVADIGQLGLLLLMFMAGLELDLDEFARRRVEAVRFGLLTFSLPMVLGIGVGMLFGLSAGAVVLFGSLWASHTLVSYPIARQHGLTGDRAVSMAVSGTVITDTLALFVLAVVVGAKTGDGGTATIVGGLLLGLAIMVAVSFAVAPRALRWFFSGPGQDRMLRFVAVVAVFTGIAVVAHLGGLEGIVGAFFAGLGVNRLVPNRSPLMERLEFFGSSLLIPFFLISTGMLIDPSQFTEPRTLGLGAASLAVVIVGKLGAAMLAGRLSGLSRPAVGLVFSLTVAQAAATLAAVIVGFDAGLFEEDLVNAALVVVLFSLIVASVGAARFAPLVPPGEAQDRRLGEAVLVPVVDSPAMPLRLRLAALLARADGGVVLALALAREDGADGGVPAARARLSEARRAVSALGVEAETAVRVVDVPGAGALRAAADHDASVLVASWEGARTAHRRLLRPDGAAAVLADSRVPVLVVSPGAADPTGVVLLLAPEDLRPGRGAEVGLGARTARLLAASLETDCRVLAPDPEVARPVLVGLERAPVNGYTGDPVAAVAAACRPGDVVVVPSHIGPATLAGPVAAIAALPDGPTLVVAATPRVHAAEAPSALVVATR